MDWISQVALVVKNPPANTGDIRDAGENCWCPEPSPHPSLLLLDDMTVLQDLDSVSQEKDQKRKKYHIHGECLAKNRTGLRMLGNRTLL